MGEITFYGETDYSGATQLYHRSDALLAASDVIGQIRRIPSSLGERTVGTTGFVDVEPDSINLIPGKVTFTWGFRDSEHSVLEEAVDRVLREAEMAAKREGFDWEYEQRMGASSVRFPINGLKLSSPRPTSSSMIARRFSAAVFMMRPTRRASVTLEWCSL